MTTRSATTQTTAYDSVGVECHRIATNAQTAPNHLLEDLATRILKIGKGTITTLALLPVTPVATNTKKYPPVVTMNFNDWLETLELLEREVLCGPL